MVRKVLTKTESCIMRYISMCILEEIRNIYLITNVRFSKCSQKTGPHRGTCSLVCAANQFRSLSTSPLVSTPAGAVRAGSVIPLMFEGPPLLLFGGGSPLPLLFGGPPLPLLGGPPLLLGGPPLLLGRPPLLLGEPPLLPGGPPLLLFGGVPPLPLLLGGPPRLLLGGGPPLPLLMFRGPPLLLGGPPLLLPQGPALLLFGGLPLLLGGPPLLFASPQFDVFCLPRECLSRAKNARKIHVPATIMQ